MVGDEIGHGASRRDPRALGLRTRARGCDDPAADEVHDWIQGIDGGQSGDRPPAAGDDDVGSLLDALEVLTQSIVELTYPDLVVPAM